MKRNSETKQYNRGSLFVQMQLANLSIAVFAGISSSPWACIEAFSVSSSLRMYETGVFCKLLYLSSQEEQRISNTSRVR
jgi:hypothetical protein